MTTIDIEEAESPDTTMSLFMEWKEVYISGECATATIHIGVNNTDQFESAVADLEQTLNKIGYRFARTAAEMRAKIALEDTNEQE